MKTLLIVLSLLITQTIFSDELKWVDEQIQAIKPARIGVSSSKIDTVIDPFIFLDRRKVKANARTSGSKSTSRSSSRSSAKSSYQRRSSLVLDIIMNESAMINGKWYKINDKVGKYTLSDIEKTNVVLKYKSSKILLSTNSKSKKLKFKNK